jgi:Tfp pilus assembly protein PilO
MRASIVEFVNAAPPSATGVESPGAYKADLEKLATAVAENALLNTEVDRRIAVNLMQAREEIVSMKEEVESLRRQFENLTRGMAHVLEATRDRR